MTTVTEPTLLEKLHALEETAHRLATERDQVRAEHADLLKAKCLLHQELNRARNNALLQERLANSLRAELDEAATDNRRLSQRCHDLAITVGALEQQIDRAQKQPAPRPDDHTKRWPWTRIGRSL